MSRAAEFGAGRLSMEDRISVAEQAMERGGLTGRQWHVPRMHHDDPARAAAHKPVHDFVRKVIRGAGADPAGVRVQPKDWDLRSGGGQAYYDGNKIALAGEHTNDMTLLHECAHAITRTTGHRGHGPEFAQTLHGLYKKHIGREAADTFANLTGLK